MIHKLWLLLPKHVLLFTRQHSQIEREMWNNLIKDHKKFRIWMLKDEEEYFYDEEFTMKIPETNEIT